MKTLSYAIAIGSALCLGNLAEDKTKEQLELEKRQNQQRLTSQERNQQSVFKPSEISEDRLKNTVTEINKASTFMGMAVKNLQNEQLGKVQDMVFDPKDGRIAYVVLSTGGFLGVAEKSVAVPLNSLQAKEGADHLLLNMSKDKLKAAPGLANNNWPKLDTFATGSAATSETGSETKQPETKTEVEPAETPDK